MKRRLLNLLTALSLLLCATTGSCSGDSVRTPVAQAGERDVLPAFTARPADAPLPDFRQREPWLPSAEEQIVGMGPTLNRLLNDVQRYSTTLNDPRATEEERLHASVGLRAAKAELRRWSLHLIDLTDTTPPG